MTFCPNDRSNRILVAAAVLGAILLAHPPLAVAADAPTTPATTAAAPPIRPARVDPEARIKSLHDRLKITAAQESQWAPVAQAMRDNAKETGGLIADRTKKTKAMTAADNLHSYQAIAQTHADGIKKLATAFDPLYAAMSDAQKKNADIVFARRATRTAPRTPG
jgi:hypothetical protein